MLRSGQLFVFVIFLGLGENTGHLQMSTKWEEGNGLCGGGLGVKMIISEDVCYAQNLTLYI